MSLSSWYKKIRIAAAPRPNEPARLQVEQLEERTVLSLTLPTPATEPYLFQPINFATPLAMHIHPTLQIFYDGQKVTIPANTGVGTISAFPVHTHDTTGTIHVESTVLRPYYLLDFFAIWNGYPSGQAIVNELGSAAAITTTDNGISTVGLLNVPFQDRVPIVIEALAPNPDSVTAANEAFVNQAYSDLLHRPADSIGLVQFTTALDQGMSRVALVQTLESSQEYQILEVQGLYSTVLHRSADQTGLTAFTNFLAGGGTLEQVEAILLGSGEFYQEYGGTNAGFLTALYSDVLQRGIDQAGEAAWNSQLANGVSAVTVAADVLASGEAEHLRVEGYYQEFLHRPADPGGLAGFTAALQNGSMTDQQLVADLVGSQEYYARSQS